MKSAPATVAAIAYLAASSVCFAAPHMNGSDIANIKRICQQFYDTPAHDVQKNLRPLRQYLASENALTNHRWVCSSQHCTGIVALRDGYEIVYGFQSIPDWSASDPFDVAPDLVRKGNNRIDAVGLVKRGKVLFAIPTNGASFLTSSNQPLQRIAVGAKISLL